MGFISSRISPYRAQVEHHGPTTFGQYSREATLFATGQQGSFGSLFRINQSVRSGEVGKFELVRSKYVDQFKSDRTFTLILRLHHNVIKTAIRRISLAYSRISLAEVAAKLKLESPKDAEYIIAKAIRDGVIEAVLDHENGWMQSKENSDIYCTR